MSKLHVVALLWALFSVCSTAALLCAIILLHTIPVGLGLGIVIMGIIILGATMGILD